ncbi:MAG TPA: zinc ribbon domain-containing protein [Syntrophomonadaceae bacterium]|nr:zinc ribbon domain-containing protein [Syntrophomonadaceae bacterium]
MPIFDFMCKECGHKFDLMVSNAEKSKVRCPQCGAEVKQLLSPFSTSSAGSSSVKDNCRSCAAAGGGG